MVDQYHSYISWLDQESAKLRDQLITWVNIHSGSGHIKGLKLIFEQLVQAFGILDGEVDQISLPPRRYMNNKGKIIEENLGKALLITKRPDADIQILLGGHMDIAYSKTKKLKKALVQGDRLIGRGSVDMKAGILILLNVLISLEKSPFAKRIGWQVLITPDEELGSPGSRSLWLKACKGKALALLFEPSLPNGHIVSSRKGSANYSLSIQGKASHAGRAYDEGENAILSACRFALAAEGLNDLASDVTVNIGMVNGGGPVNIVPDSAVLKFNIRCQTPQELNLIELKIKEIVRIENNKEHIQATLFQESIRPPKIFDKKTHTLFEAVKRSAGQIGILLQWKASGGVCDGNLTAGQGILTVDTLGAVGGCLHTENEYVILPSLVERTKLTARFLMQIAAGEIQIP